jgi:hypothetical protein
METIEKLMQLQKDQLQTISLWILRDLINWAGNDRVVSNIRGHNQMLLEAYKYQIDKAYSKMSFEEE